jgi:hypothetical protein
MATSVAVIIVTWLAVSVVVVVGFAVGSAIGYRRGFEDGQRLTMQSTRTRTIQVDDSDHRAHVSRAARQ